MIKIHEDCKAFPANASERGMTIRQYYIGQILMGLVTTKNFTHGSDTRIERAAQTAIILADATIKLLNNEL